MKAIFTIIGVTATLFYELCLISPLLLILWKGAEKDVCRFLGY